MMFKEEKLPIQHRLAVESLSMPVNSILCLPRYVTDQPSYPIFNLFGAVARVFENYGWDRGTKIIDPYIWAPGWTEEQIVNFAVSPLPGPGLLSNYPEWVTIKDVFPGTGMLSDPSNSEYREFPIVHFIGRLVELGGGNYSLDLGTEDGGAMDSESLLKAMHAARTRVLILQMLNQADFNTAISIGRNIVAGGGPAVVVVQSDSLEEIVERFVQFYFNLTHHYKLPDMVESPWYANIDVHLIFGDGGEDLLQFGGYLKMISRQFEATQAKAIQESNTLDNLLERMESHLHEQQRKSLGGMIFSVRESYEEIAPEIDKTRDNLRRAEEVEWYHEGDGTVPLSESTESLELIEEGLNTLRARFAELQAELEREVSLAPRVLNANFAHPNTGRVFGLRDGLVEGQKYFLLVDVGPRWNKIPSAVVGAAQFPEEALPPDKDGYLVDVVLISEDFSPELSSTQIWVPRGSGRSFPTVDGELAENSGPVALPVTAPGIPEDFSELVLIAHARLCLYYENNLLQSAVVTAGVVPSDGVPLELDNKVEVDYVLTGGFRDVVTSFATRGVKFDPQAETPGVPVTLNLALNDDGAGGHRIIVKGRQGRPPATPGAPPNVCPPHGWTPYDPLAGSDLLEDARQALLNCFFEKHEAVNQFGEVVKDQQGNPVFGLKPDNSKSLVQFKIDLLLLAKQGRDLWATAFDQVKIEDDLCIPAEWRRNLKSILANSALIQISRTGPAQYVFPWTMVYEYSLNESERSKWQFCKIVDEEWSLTGIRQGLVMERQICKYHQEGWHRKNIICPYGFWGLKHIIEEPPSLPSGKSTSLDNAEKEIFAGKEIDISTAITEDVNLDSARIRKHIKYLGSIPGIQLSLAQPKQDWEGLRPLLRAPEVVYFLCHGEYDELENEPYLSIGPRDADVTHRIYPRGTLADWIEDDVDGPDITLWKRQHPLIFINGCHTADLKPGQIVSFATTFAGVGASGVLGTEVSVTLPVAIEVAESLFDKLSTEEGMTLGEALRQIRWELVNKGNLLGLAYTLYGLAELHIKRDGG